MSGRWNPCPLNLSPCAPPPACSLRGRSLSERVRARDRDFTPLAQERRGSDDEECDGEGGGCGGLPRCVDAGKVVGAGQLWLALEEDDEEAEKEEGGVVAAEERLQAQPEEEEARGEARCARAEHRRRDPAAVEPSDWEELQRVAERGGEADDGRRVQLHGERVGREGRQHRVGERAQQQRRVQQRGRHYRVGRRADQCRGGDAGGGGGGGGGVGGGGRRGQTSGEGEADDKDSEGGGEGDVGTRGGDVVQSGAAARGAERARQVWGGLGRPGAAWGGLGRPDLRGKSSTRVTQPKQPSCSDGTGTGGAMRTPRAAAAAA